MKKETYKGRMKTQNSNVKLLKRLWRNRYYYLFLLPACLLFFFFNYVPMGGIVLAFKDYTFKGGIWNSDWVGLAHFKRIFDSVAFGEILRNTVVISVYKIVFGFLAPIIFALLINEIKSSRFKKVVQTVSYLPHFISWVILGSILKEMLSPNSGIVNYLLGLIGVKPIYFLGEPSLFRGVLVVTDIWATVGWGSIIYLAAIAGVDKEQYESAAIDGANRWDMAVRITLPSILPTIITMFILRLGSVLNAGFDQIFNLYNPTVYSVADVIDTYVYRVGLKDVQYDYTTAIGLFQNVIGCIMIILANYITGKIGEGENKIW